MSSRWFVSLIFICVASSCLGQFPTPQPEHEVLKKDVGTWEATTKTWMGPDGTPDSTVEPQVSVGTETNTMLGDFWVVSVFKSNFGGMEFEGRSTTGFDAEKKQFVGYWADSMSPHLMNMQGTYDKATDTMTFKSKGRDMSGKATEGKMVVKYNKDGSRVMTMYDIAGDKEVKVMEVSYKKIKD